MSVASEATAIWRRAMRKPTTPRRWQVHLHCIYCDIVVGETVLIEGEREYERYVKTDKGPVCEACEVDPLAAFRVDRGDVMDMRRRVVNKGMLRRRDGSVNPGRNHSKDERDAEIVRLSSEGMTQAIIAAQFRLSASQVGHIIRTARAVTT